MSVAVGLRVCGGLHAWAAEFIELTYLGIPYRIPPDVDGKPTVKKAGVLKGRK